MAVNRKRGLGVGAVLLSATCFALTSILLKIALHLGLTPLAILALQSWLASVLLLAYDLIFRRDIFRLSGRKTLAVLALQGIVGSLGTSILYTYALVYLPVSVATLLLYLYPAFVLAAGVLFWNKKAGVKEMTALLLTLAGTILASGVLAGARHVSVLGVILGFASALAYTVFNLVGEVALTQISPLATMSFSQWFSSLGLVFALRGGWTAIPWHDYRILGVGLALATVASIFPFYFLLVGIKHIGSDQAAILSTFELPMTFVLAELFLGEVPGWSQWGGGFLVLAGIILLNWRGFRGEAREG
ncbi:EamA-like transporter family protein [Peptococcaceae bacterium CEB3]|nr:EamA-like transporter family protein [Peptococcaceae bacterium CEB3]